MKKLYVWSVVVLFLCALVLALMGCSESSGPTSPTSIAPVIAPVFTVDPKIVASDVKIVSSNSRYYVVSWQFTIDSPKNYGYAYVEIHWLDKDNFSLEWSNWTGALKKGTHVYVDETWISKDIWPNIVRRKVELKSWS